MTKPILITGVGGFIASHLAERLLREGQPVRGLARRPERAGWLADLGVEVVAGDLLRPESIAQAADGCAAIVHAAAWTGGSEISEDAGYRANLEGTANVLAAARSAHVERLVYLSSVAVYGLNNAPVIDETMPTPVVGQAYPDSKIAAEELVRRSDLPTVVVRPASTYGPRGEAWTCSILRQIQQGRLVLLGADDGLVTPGFIDNVVDGLCLALTHPDAVGQAFNLCDATSVTYREFYLAYARMLGKNSLPTLPSFAAHLARTLPANLLRRMLGRPVVGQWSLHFRLHRSRFSIAKAQRLLGYSPDIDFSEGMRRTAEWVSGWLSN